MIEQIVIERLTEGWYWGIWGAHEFERPEAQGSATTLEGAVEEVERYIREEGADRAAAVVERVLEWEDSQW